MSRKLSYPEIEAAGVESLREVRVHYEHLKIEPPATLVDLLEIGQIRNKSVWKTGLGHDSLLAYFEHPPFNTKIPITPPLLRVFFVGIPRPGSDNAERYKRFNMEQPSQLHPSTSNWMRDRFHVSPIFLGLIASRNYVTNGYCGSYLERNNKGDVATIAGFYFLNSIFYGPSCHVWFSHDLKTGCSTYILDNCPDGTKSSILECAFGDHPETVGRVCAIDAFIAYDNSKKITTRINANNRVLSQFEGKRPRLQGISPSEIALAVEKLHRLAQNFHGVFGHGSDLVEHLEFLLDVHHKNTTHSRGFLTKAPVAVSLQFLAGRTRMWNRWAMNYKERTDIQINLYFNLAAQNDSRTNLDIANLTSKIAIDTQRDSSSMITVAAITMFFLPGTFISAIFSMVFFSSGTDKNGKVVITASPQWWYFIAITIPLTMVVFLAWVLWQRWRNKVRGIGNSKCSGEKV